MIHPEQTVRFDWHRLPDVVRLPGHRDSSRLGSVPASPSSPIRRTWRPGKALSYERTLAMVLTCGVWSALAIVAACIRLAETSVTAF